MKSNIKTIALPILVSTALASACVPGGSRGIDVGDEETEQTEQAQTKTADVSHAPGIEPLKKFGYKIEVPLTFAENPKNSEDLRLLSISCNPVINPRKVEFENFGVNTVIMRVSADMFGNSTECSSVIVADSAGLFFESPMTERIVLPTDVADADSDPGIYNQLKVQFKGVELPQHSVISAEIAKNVKMAEDKKRLLEEQAIASKRVQRQLQEQIDAIKVKEAEAQAAEKNRLIEEKRRLEAEKAAKDAELAAELAELNAAIKKEQLELSDRLKSREQEIRENAEKRLEEQKKKAAEREKELEESKQELENLKKANKLRVDLIEVTETTVIECSIGEKLNIETMSCEL